MPAVIPLLALGIFAMVTSEFTVAGLMPQLAADLDVSVPQVGYLVTAFALAMALGGPPLTAALLRVSHKRALLTLFAVFLVGNVLAAVSTSYPTMLLARVVTGAAAGAFFGIAITAAAHAVAAPLRARATASVLQGLMLGTTLGLPLATWVGGQWGWRAAFVTIGVLTVLAATATAVVMPDAAPQTAAGGGVRTELAALRSVRLWTVMGTSTLVIGATFAAFSYATPILHEVTGVDLSLVPLLLLAYGLATVVGTAVVGRLATQHMLPVLIVGTTLAALVLVAFALGAASPWVAVPALLGLGLVGVTMNPAMVTRVQRAGGTGALVNTVHTSMITLGVALGSTLGGLGTGLVGLRAPLWVGAGLAAAAVLAMLPAFLRERSERTAASAPAPVDAVG